VRFSPLIVHFDFSVVCDSVVRYLVYEKGRCVCRKWNTSYALYNCTCIQLICIHRGYYSSVVMDGLCARVLRAVCGTMLVAVGCGGWYQNCISWHLAVLSGRRPQGDRVVYRAAPTTTRSTTVRVGLRIVSIGYL